MAGRIRYPIRWFILVTVLFAIALFILRSGVLNASSGTGQVKTDVATGSLVVYWLVACAIVTIIANFRVLWKNLLLLLITVTVVFAFTEILTRIFLPPFHGIRSERYHHLYQPNKNMFEGVYGGQTVFIKTNEDGLRTPWSRAAFKAKRERIVILGDSFTLGVAVREESTFVTLLQSSLNERMKTDDIAVLNAGVISYSPYLENLLYRGVLREYNPTLVVLMLDATDIGDDHKYASETIHDSTGLRFDVYPDAGSWSDLYTILSPLIQKPVSYISYPFEVVLNRLRKPGAVYDYYAFEVRIDSTVDKNRYFIYRFPLEKTRPYFEHTLANIRNVAAAATASGARFALLVSPRYHHWNPRECPQNWEWREYKVNEPYQYEYFRFFDQVRDSVDFPIVDLLPAFRATQEFPLVFDQDVHWNSRGHAFVARTLADTLLHGGYVRPSAR